MGNFIVAYEVSRILLRPNVNNRTKFNTIMLLNRLVLMNTDKLKKLQCKILNIYSTILTRFESFNLNIIFSKTIDNKRMRSKKMFDNFSESCRSKSKVSKNIVCIDYGNKSCASIRELSGQFHINQWKRFISLLNCLLVTVDYWTTSTCSNLSFKLFQSK